MCCNNELCRWITLSQFCTLLVKRKAKELLQKTCECGKIAHFQKICILPEMTVLPILRLLPMDEINCCLHVSKLKSLKSCQVFLRCFRDPIRVPKTESRVPRITENHHGVTRIREIWFPRIREIGSLQVHTGYLTFP